MKNPWESIDLKEYEKHMKSDSVRQLQALNTFMNTQLNMFSIKSVMVLGVAGGNGLDHIDTDKIDKVYGIDINGNYLTECKRRYSDLENVLECLCVDLTNKNVDLPYADMVIANLLIEYIGYENFCNLIVKISPKYVSCVIQKNTKDGFVSETPYTHIFNNLERIHVNITEKRLSEILQCENYRLVDKSEKFLPNGKKLVMLTYKKI